MPPEPAHRILVVDDEPNIVDVITMALRYQGFETESAGTGREALTAVGSFRPQVMILDVMLPDMEGFEVAERLGAERGHVPIIFLSARDAAEDKLRGLCAAPAAPGPTPGCFASRTSSSTRTPARSLGPASRSS